MNLRHTVLWLDHQEARLFGVEEGKLDEKTIHAPHRHLHRHPKGAPAERNHPDDVQHFYRDVAQNLEGAEQILVLGPSTAKVEFFRFAHKHAPAVEKNIVGLETVDHPTDGQIVAYAKRYFGIPERVR